MLLPKYVHIVEVGPRDGFQNIKKQIPTKLKIETIEKLISAGVKELEVTSFVHPKAIPQMADAIEVADHIVKHYGNKTKIAALVPNIRGAENALKCGVHAADYVISASESHNRANVNRSVRESEEELKKLLLTYGTQLPVRLDIATAFYCPYEGKTPLNAVLSLIEYAGMYGVDEFVLCDTIGYANPLQIYETCRMVLERYDVSLGLHLHDTRGMGLANTLAGIQAGVSIFESSIGGLGGCPFAPGAAGNTATEDMLNMLLSMKIDTGISQDRYMDAVEFVRDNIQQTLTGHMVTGCRPINLCS